MYNVQVDCTGKKCKCDFVVVVASGNALAEMTANSPDDCDTLSIDLSADRAHSFQRVSNGGGR